MDRNSFGLSRADSVSVALRKESVDRNAVESSGDKAQAMSLSARRAWIETEAASAMPAYHHCRSPQGERG